MRPYYEQDGITIYHGDCRDVLPGLSPWAADCVVTDPPYGTGNLAGGYGRRQLWDTGDGNGRTIANDSDLSVFAAAWPMLRLKVANGWGAVFYAPRRTPEFADVVGPDWFGEVVWDKKAPGLGYHVRYAHESIAILRLGHPERPPRPIMSVLRASAISDVHPHEKPQAVLLPLVEWCSPVGGLVLDPFAGSGTSLLAAKELGRRAIGIEIEERYCEIAAKRLAQGVLPLHGEVA
jgi:DNA modification methylase